SESWNLTIQKVIQEEPVPPTRHKSEVPADLEAVCLKCLEKEPDRRYVGALELAEDLRRFLAEEPVSAQPYGEWERRVRWAGRIGYQLEAELGRGVLGVTYKARHLDRPVALKVIVPTADNSHFADARGFRTAAIRLARLQHPNIVPIHDVAEADGLYY